MSLPTAAVDEARRMLEASDAERDRTRAEAERELLALAGNITASEPDPEPTEDLADISANNLQPAQPEPTQDDDDGFGFDHPITGQRITGSAAELVLREAGKIEVRNLARLIVTEREFTPPPEAHSIQWHMDNPPEVTAARIERILAVGGRATVVAPRKIGKTTVVVNVARSLTTGEDLFDRWRVRQCRVHVLNYEVTGYQFATWGNEAGVGDGLMVSSLRGVSNPLVTARGRRELARQIADGGAEVLIVDPYSAASVGCVEREGDNVGHRRFLAELDELANDAGCSELIVPMHSSLKADDPDSTRGGTALEDWPDVIWRLSQDDNGERFFSAMGRDVDVPEDRLMFNQSNRRLSFGMQRVGKRDAKAARGRDALVGIIRADPGISTADLKEALRSEITGFGNDTAVNALLKQMAHDRVIERRSGGPGTATRHYLGGSV